MEETPLHTDNGGFVTKVMIPHFNPPASWIMWGQRMFLRREDGRYYEEFGVVATVTVPEENTGI